MACTPMPSGPNPEHNHRVITFCAQIFSAYDRCTRREVPAARCVLHQISNTGFRRAVAQGWPRVYSVQQKLPFFSYRDLDPPRNVVEVRIRSTMRALSAKVRIGSQYLAAFQIQEMNSNTMAYSTMAIQVRWCGESLKVLVETCVYVLNTGTGS